MRNRGRRPKFVSACSCGLTDMKHYTSTQVPGQNGFLHSSSMGPYPSASLNLSVFGLQESLGDLDLKVCACKQITVADPGSLELQGFSECRICARA